MLNALTEIIENGGCISPTTLRSITIRDLNMSNDGRDINIHYRIFDLRTSAASAIRNAGFREDVDADDIFFDMSREKLVETHM